MVREFIDDLLTPTEKIMLSKRLTAAYFIEKGYNYRFISEVLKMSPTTINTIQKGLLQSGIGYRAVFRLIAKSSKLEELIEKLDSFISSVIPPVKGSKSGYRR